MLDNFIKNKCFVSLKNKSIKKKEINDDIKTAALNPFK